MADGRANNGAKKGVSRGQGRKPKADEIKKLDLMDSVAAPKKAWQALWLKCEEGDTPAIKAWLEHRFGKPKETVDLAAKVQVMKSEAELLADYERAKRIIEQGR